MVQRHSGIDFKNSPMNDKIQDLKRHVNATSKKGLLSPLTGNARPPQSSGGEKGGDPISAAGASGWDPPSFSAYRSRAAERNCPALGLQCPQPHLAETPFCCFGRDLKLAKATGCPLCLQPCLLSPCFGFSLESCPCYLRAFATAVLICGNVPLYEHLPVLAQLPLPEQPGLAPGPAGWVPLLYCQPNELLLQGAFHVINYAGKPRNNYLHISTVLIGS